MEKSAVVATKSGKLEGYFTNGLYTFKGVPYAAPPVGNLRWLPPRPVKRWSGVRPAKKYGPISPQNQMLIASVIAPNFGDQPQDEDCLFLNIWTPGLDDARRPVLFWIHGGAFILGAGTEAFLEGGSLARRGDIVLVTINYRLGALGFMNLDTVTGGKIPATGNEGILDQIAALKWVKENIAAFGGNPDNITISGFSAGGMSVGTLLSMPAAKGLFNKTINRSGAANIVGSLNSAEKITEKFLKIVKLGGKDTAALRKLTVKQLLDAQQELGNTLRQQEYRATPFQPVVDGKVLPKFPMQAIKEGSAKGIIVMAGNTRDELKAMTGMDPATSKMDEAGLLKRMSDVLPADLVPGLLKCYRGTLKQASGVDPKPSDIWGSINTDLMFRIPTIRLVEAQRDLGMPSYNYLFAYRSPAMGGLIGAMHGLDNPFLFGSLDAAFTGTGPELESMVEKIQDSVAAFARTGDPSCQSIGKWPVYGKDRLTMVLDRVTRVEAAPYEEERCAWDRYDLVNTRPM